MPILGMSTGSADLYVSWESRTGPTLYNVSTTTANSVLVGYPSASFGALVSIDGTLYGGADPSNAVYTISTANGASTFQANVTGTTNTFYGLASAPARATAAVPEPATWGLMLVGFGASGIAIRRRAKVRSSTTLA